MSLAILASLGLHGLTGAVIAGSSLWGFWREVPVDIEITGTRLEDLQDVPLGMPATGERKADAVIAPTPGAPVPPSTPDRRRTPPKPVVKRGPQVDVSDPDGGAAPPRPTSVRSYAPQGSRVTALMRIDRLRGTVYAAAVDGLLMHLPDRRDLLEGTEIDLYRDVDAILIATPNPLDARVTFLAVRHRLTDMAMRAALERGARATGRKLAWRTERGRPFAERRSAVAAPTAGGNRDQRLILLAAPHLVVITPPAYRNLILRGRADAAPGAVAQEGGGRHPDAGVDGGTGDAGPATSSSNDGNGWAALLRRIDAEDSVMPADAVAMVSAVDLFSARGLPTAIEVAPGTRGAVDDAPTAGATVLGLPVPRVVTATLGVTPQPFADLDAEFAEGDAIRWEQRWSSLRHELLANPLVVLTGFAGLVSRATLTRAAGTVHLHVEATELETTRILELLSLQMSAFGR